MDKFNNIVSKNIGIVAIILLIAFILSPVAVIAFANTAFPNVSNGASAGLKVLLSETIQEEMEPLKNRVDVFYTYTVNEMVRFIEKQYTKVKDKPNDLYQTDLEYLINDVWPIIPESKRTTTLESKYKYLLNFYNDSIAKNI